MVYEKPKLAMFLGSKGGYLAFKKAMAEVYRDIVKKGAVYLVEHRYRPEPKELMMEFQTMGMDLDIREAEDGMVLENGFYVCRGLPDKGDFYTTKRKVPSTAFKKFEGDVIRFHDFKVNLELEKMLDFQIKKAIEAGYGEDMRIVILSGSGGDGCRGMLQKACERGSKILIQEPKETTFSQMPNNALHTARFMGLDHDVLPSYGIGRKVNEFFSD